MWAVSAQHLTDFFPVPNAVDCENVIHIRLRSLELSCTGQTHSTTVCIAELHPLSGNDDDDDDDDGDDNNNNSREGAVGSAQDRRQAS